MEVKICLISDTHTRHNEVEVPECDILIHSGDYTSRGYRHEVEDFYKWLTKQNQVSTIVFIEGNHDIHADSKFNKETRADEWFQDLQDEYLSDRIVRLCNTGVQTFGLNIWGSPITPDFYPEFWGFNMTRGEKIARHWETIPDNTDILVTHGPPFAILDNTPRNELVGCSHLIWKINQINLKIHTFGHIHHSHGIKEVNKTTFVNAAQCNERNQIEYKPRLITLEI
jgi:predicted phosphodiesterase